MMPSGSHTHFFSFGLNEQGISKTTHSYVNLENSVNKFVRFSKNIEKHVQTNIFNTVDFPKNSDWDIRKNTYNLKIKPRTMELWDDEG